MRVAAVALVLIVGAAVVLAFANTLNSWVLGGLLGGLAAILISIPISLALFTLLARRHDTHQSQDELLEVQEYTDDDFYYDPDDRMVYAAEGIELSEEDDFPVHPAASPFRGNVRRPVSGYLALPTPDRHEAFPEDELDDERLEPRNYPRQPRYPARALSQDQRSTSSTQNPAQGNGSRRPRSTRSLSQHQSTALRVARQEAQQKQENRAASSSQSRRTQENRLSASQRPRTSRQLRPPSPPKTTSTQRSFPTQETWSDRQERVWRSLDREDPSATDQFTTGQVREPYQPQHYPRRPSYPRKPRASRYAETWTGDLAEEQDETPSRNARRDSNRPGGTMRNPLVRRAPYLYDDDPLREEFAQQLDAERPITRRSSRYETYEDEDEY